MDTVLYRSRFILVGITVVACLIIASFLIPAGSASQVHAQSSDAPYSLVPADIENSPNAVASSAAVVINRSGAAIRSSGTTAAEGLLSIRSVASQTGQFFGDATMGLARGSTNFVVGSGRLVGTTASFVGRGLFGAAGFAARGLGSFVVLSVHTTGAAFATIADAPGVSSVIKPSSSGSVPTIKKSLDANSAASATTKSPATLAPASIITQQPAAQPAPHATPAADTATAWPIHGAITTYFGASDWPYQLVHTGIDISSGHAAGVTPVRPYKSGRVTGVVHSGVSLGNHIVIDHGGGITSVYGHLYSTSVQVGQEVDTSTVLGYEGSTGASTGPHVHFEIRLNGQPVNPQSYISGQP